MTLDEFFDELAACNLTWKIKNQSHRRPMAIRAGDDPQFGPCPVVAVAIKLGAVLGTTFYPVAAYAMGLPRDVATEIANAADFADDADQA